jgi:hypothetical protein
VNLRTQERDREAIATTTLLRAPAAAIAGAYVVGLVVGQSARPLSADALSIGFYVATAIVLLPFVLPSRWFARAPAVLRGWMIGAAIVATARAVFVAGWLFARLPAAAWVPKVLFDVVILAALWLAALGPVRLARRFGDDDLL